MAKKRAGLLRRPNTITGEKSIPKGLKPQKARQLIRRFHVLQKNKYSIIMKLGKLQGDSEVSLDTYKSRLLGSASALKIYENSYSEFKLNKKETTLIRLDDKMSQNELLRQLGSVDSEIDKRGGINAYQSASTQGQTNNRGGDSSKKLIKWLKDSSYSDRLKGENTALEIGSLSPTNIISTCGIFQQVDRIDLNSQNPLILKQDFMERPLPKDSSEQYHLVSCSLVVNFVPSPLERGQMLSRITKFLKKPTPDSVSSLFFVLPLPCIKNSRYFDDETLQNIMTYLGFEKRFYYEAKKVAYWLYDWTGKVSSKKKKFGKKELYAGATKNNFCITLE